MRVFFNSSTIIKRGPNERKLSTILKNNLSRFKFEESARESLRAHESFRPNESESLNSQQLSSSFGPGFRISLLGSIRCLIVFADFCCNFSSFPSGIEDPQTVFTLVVVSITIFFFVARVCFGMFKRFGPHKVIIKFWSYNARSGWLVVQSVYTRLSCNTKTTASCSHNLMQTHTRHFLFLLRTCRGGAVAYW